MLVPLTKLVRSVGRGFRREQMVQTVIWLSGLPREFAIGECLCVYLTLMFISPRGVISYDPMSLSAMYVMLLM